VSPLTLVYKNISFALINRSLAKSLHDLQGNTMSTPTSTSGGQSSSEATGYSSPTSVPPSGNGKSPQTAAWSSALTLDPNTKKTYVVDGLGLFPRYRRTTLVDARSAAQVYTVLNGDTYQAVTQLPPGPMANPTMPAATGEAAQIAEIGTHETVVASGTAPAAIQYTETQAARKFRSSVSLYASY
jgi:hypothetical protein